MSTKPAAISLAASQMRLGEYHPAYGGHYAGIVRGEEGRPDYYLFVAPKDRGEASKLTWGSYVVNEPGAELTHDGAANTAALIKSKADHPAAKFCDGLIIDGHKDYYLPSREELRLAFINCKALFEPLWYWSSTQYAGYAYSAWMQHFDSGNQTNGRKDTSCRVRAVRRLVIQ
jgi:Protein of unknown function (DUF1566)